MVASEVRPFTALARAPCKQARAGPRCRTNPAGLVCQMVWLPMLPRVTIVKHGTRHDDHAALAADGAAVALTACGGFCIRILRFAAEPTPCPPTPRLGQPGCAEPAARTAAPAQRRLSVSSHVPVAAMARLRPYTRVNTPPLSHHLVCVEKFTLPYLTTHTALLVLQDATDWLRTTRDLPPFLSDKMCSCLR